MRSGFLFRLLFVVYCVEVGLFFLIWPWMGSYDRIWWEVRWSLLRYLGQGLVARSLVSSFGALHLLWALHDVDLMLSREKRS